LALRPVLARSSRTLGFSVRDADCTSTELNHRMFVEQFARSCCREQHIDARPGERVSRHRYYESETEPGRCRHRFCSNWFRGSMLPIKSSPTAISSPSNISREPRPPIFFCLVPTGPIRSLVSYWWIICRVQNTQILRTSLCSHIVAVSLVVCSIVLIGYEYGLTHSRPPNKKRPRQRKAKDTTLVESVSRESRLTVRCRRPELKRMKLKTINAATLCRGDLATTQHPVWLASELSHPERQSDV